MALKKNELMQNSNSNIIESEIETFSQLAIDWWEPDGKLKTLHVINPLRLRYIKRRVNIHNKHVLDIGCGGGLLSEAMAKETAYVTGIDMSQDLIDIAKQHAQVSDVDVDYYVDSIESFAENTDRKYDIITCMEMLEHVPDPGSVISAVKRLLNPRGHLFISTINRTAKSYIQMVLSAEYLLKLIPINTHHYSQFIKPHELAALLKYADLSLRNISGIRYVPFIDYCSFTDDVSVNYILHAINDDI